MEARTTKVRATLAPRMDRTRYTHSYVVTAFPQYGGYKVPEEGMLVTHLGLVTWNQEDRERRNDESRQIARLTECAGVYTIRVVGPLTVRDWSVAKLVKARAHNGMWTYVWTGVNGVTVTEAVTQLRALRDALQADADAYWRGL